MATFDDLERVLSAAASGELRDAVRLALVETAQRAEREAKLNATTRPRVRTGRLRGSIAWRVVPDTRGVTVAVGAGTQWGPRGEVRYAAIQELGGWTRVPIGSRTRAGVQRRAATARTVAGAIPATYFLRRGVDKAIGRLPDELARAVSVVLEVK